MTKRMLVDVAVGAVLGMVAMGVVLLMGAGVAVRLAAITFHRLRKARNRVAVEIQGT